MLTLFLTITLANADTCHDWRETVEAIVASTHCPTAALVQAQFEAQLRHQTACLRLALKERGLEHSRPSPKSTPTTGDDRELHQVYTGMQVIASEHFAVWWDNNGGLAVMDDADAVADAMERAWSAEINELSYPAPATTDTTYFNVYIGDSGDAAPSSNGAGGYYWTDSEGYPYIVLALNSVNNLEYLDVLAAHEFFHAIQDSTGAYSYIESEPGAWYWEATAVWAETELYPDSAYSTDLLFGLAFLPELPIDHFNYPDLGTADEYHQYGAFLFPRFLTDFPADSSLIYQSWVMSSSADPLESIDHILDDWGTTVDDEFFTFATHNATWDYEHALDYTGALYGMGGFDHDWSHRPTATIDDTIPLTEPNNHLPSGFGANYWHLEGHPSELTVNFEARSLPDEWRVTVVTQESGVHSYFEMPLKAGVGELTVPEIDYWADVIVVVAATDQVRDEEMTYRYALAVEYPEQEITQVQTADIEPATGCGCSTWPGKTTTLLWLLSTLLLTVRRRGQ